MVQVNESAGLMYMGVKRRHDAFYAFITRDLEHTGLEMDLIVKDGEDRYKSVKFRHRYYKSEDFELTFEAAMEHHHKQDHKHLSGSDNRQKAD
jgi:hypothetical protein